VLQQNSNGLGLKAQDSIDFIKFLSAEARKYGLAIGLKNSASIIGEALPYVDFAVNEQCAAYKECNLFAAFTAANKPVFQIEYPNIGSNGAASSDRKKACALAAGVGSDRFSTVIKEYSLDGWVQYCDGAMYETPTN
jgi:hypothetical protein